MRAAAAAGLHDLLSPHPAASWNKKKDRVVLRGDTIQSRKLAMTDLPICPS